MSVAAYGHFKEVPPSWTAFVKVLEDRFMPSDIKNRLTEELGRLKMDGDDFNRYYSQFQAYCQHIQTTDESMLVMIFIRGLEITLQHAVQLARPATLTEAYEAAWKAHLGPARPCAVTARKNAGKPEVGWIFETRIPCRRSKWTRDGRRG